MQYTPKSREELDQSKLIPADTFDVECYDCTEKQSKKGNDMMEIKLKVYVGEATRFYTDYIVPSNDMGLDKLYTLCAATDKLDAYERGVEEDDLLGFQCKALFIQRKDKETGELRNELRSYSAPGDVEEDDIPF